jgi:hypothetical protein
MTAVGFEPTRIAPPELESGALDHSAKLSAPPEKRTSRTAYINACAHNKIEARAIRTPNRLIWSQTRYRCAIAPRNLQLRLAQPKSDGLWQKEWCISRESNPGHIDGNDVFYH